MEPGLIEGTMTGSEHVDHARIASTTEEDVQRYMREDGDIEESVGRDTYRVLAALVRAKTGLSQTAFADAIGVPVKTWRNWEQERTNIEPAGRALLRLLAADPRGSLEKLRTGDR